MSANRRRSRAAPARVLASAPSPPPSALRWRAGVIVLAGILAYANSLSGPFIFDDDATVVDNPHIRDFRPANVLFPRRELPVAGRPLVNLSFAINYAIGGVNVRGYHVANLAIHLLCGLVLFGFVRRTLELPAGRHRLVSNDLAFAVALLWTLHPLNTEVVDYVTQRTESMMALFYLLTMYASVRAATSVRAWSLLAVLSCALGMACKESMVTAPVMILLYDRIFLFDSFRKAMRTRWALYAGLAATWIVLAAVLWSGPRLHSAGFSTNVSPWTYLLNQTVMITRYLRLALWPRSLVLAYGAPQPVTLGDVMPYALFVVLLLGATAFALWRRPMLGFLGAWMFVTLAPTSSIVPIATEVGAERRMYLPLAALVTLAVIGGAMAVRYFDGVRLLDRRRAAAAVLGIVALALGTATALRNREYASALGMAQTVVDRWPTGFAHTMLGTALAIAGRHDEAIAHLREAARDYPRARYHLGGELFNQGRLEEAEEQLQRFVEHEPDLVEAVRARLMMGRVLLTQRRYAPATDQFRLVLSMTAERDDAHITAIGFLGDALFEQDQFDEAVRYYSAYLTARPNDAGALTNLGISLASTGKADQALPAFRRAVEIDPANASARQNLARALLNQGDLEGAAAQATQLLRMREDAVGHDLLGRVLGSQGKIDEAVREFERALQIDPTYEQARQDLAVTRRGIKTRRAIQN